MSDLYKNRNRLAKRSIKALQNALLDLLNEKPYQKITITEIAEKSGLTRSTFYSHFETKDDLLASIIDNVLDQFFTKLEQRDVLNPDVEQDIAINISLFEIWRDSQEINELTNKVDIEKLILDRFKQYWVELFAARIVVARPEISQALGEYINTFLAYAKFAILWQWIDQGMVQSPEDMGRMLYLLTGPPVLDKLIEDFQDVIL